MLDGSDTLRTGCDHESEPLSLEAWNVCEDRRLDD